MPYNLLYERWIPVRRQSGAEDCIAPHEIAALDDPPIALASQRPDFDGALAQMLIGLVQTTMPPDDDEAWANRWLNPPRPDDLRHAFASASEAFHLNGGGARFFQDLDPLDHGSLNPPAYLLIETPTGDNNRDHFVKNRDADVLSLPAAAMALLSMQTNAPSGGRGHRTSLRGGGPITTIVLGRTLWETVWLNVLPASASGERDGLSGTFPWLASTRTSDNGEETLPTDVNPLQAFWGMPRRIRLVVSNEGGTCALTGQHADCIVAGYWTRPGGVNYAGPWEHPLSPHYQTGTSAPIPVHGQPARIAYKDWLGYVYAPRPDEAGKKASQTIFTPARVVEQFHRRAEALWMDDRFAFLTSHDGPRLWTFGFDTDNMKVRGWQEGTFPLFGGDPQEQAAVEVQARMLVEVARSATSHLKRAVKNGLFGSPEITGRGRVSWDFPHHIDQDQKLLQRSQFSALETEFWDATQPDFFGMLRETRDATSERRIELRERWLLTLKRTALDLYDRAVQTDERARTESQAVVLARRDLEILPRRKDLRNTLGLPTKSAQPADA